MRPKYPSSSPLRHCASASALGGVLGPEIVRHGGGRGGAGRELPRHGDESQPRKHRDQQREGEQHVAQLAIERPAVEQEMQPEAAVHPARRHHAELHALRVREPERGHHPRVVRRHPEQLPRQPGIGRVSDQHDRQGEAERDAQELQRRQAEGAPLVHRPQREHEMDRERAVQQHGPERARPDLDREFERGFGGLERNEPERVVDQVGGDVGEEHEAGGEPQAPPHRAGGQVRNQSVAPRWRGARRRGRSYTQSGMVAFRESAIRSQRGSERLPVALGPACHRKVAGAARNTAGRAPSQPRHASG